MRKKRAILFDDEHVVLDVLTFFFEEKGYEVMAFREPVACPVYQGQENCPRTHACADVVITDYKMPRMNGLDLLREQIRGGCKLSILNKALISGFLDSEEREAAMELGCAFFEKPVMFDRLSEWINECESRIDLSLPLGIRRREPRQACSFEIRYRNNKAGASLRGITVNMSRSGLCIRTDSSLDAGESITFQASGRQPLMHALVRWSVPLQDGKYLVGLHLPS